MIATTTDTLVNAVPPAPTFAERREVAFIDTGVADWQTLVAGIRPDQFLFRSRAVCAVSIAQEGKRIERK